MAKAPSKPLVRRTRRRTAAAVSLALAGLAFAAPAALADAVVPTNDDFANATPITLDSNGSGSITGSTVVSTREANEPLVRDETAGSVWYRITSPVDVPLVVDTCASDVDRFDTLLGVYTGGAVDALSVIASNDDGCANYQSSVTIPAQAGVPYYVQVGGFGDGYGTFELTVSSSDLQSPELVTNFDGTVNPLVNRPAIGQPAAPGVSVTCALDGAASRPCTLPYLLTGANLLPDGPHELIAGQTFGAYTSPTSSSSFTIDTVAPTVNLTDGPTDGATVDGSTQTWTVASSEYLSWARCVIDGATVDCDSERLDDTTYKVHVSDLCTGVHTIAVTGRDQAHNDGPSSVARTITVTDGVACGAPTFSSETELYDEATEVYLEIDVNAHGSGTRGYVEYGTTTDYGARVDVETGPRIGVSEVYAELRFLSSDTEYHARWVFENAHGRIVSDDIAFTTDEPYGPAPTVSSLPVSGLDLTTATLNANLAVNESTAARFEYGTTTSYGSVTPRSWGAGPLSVPLRELQPNTVYHYRLAASNGGQTVFTPDATFLTSGAVAPPIAAPPIVAPPVKNVGPSPAQITKDVRAALKKVKLSRKGLRSGKAIRFKLRTRSAGTTRLSGTVRRAKGKKSIAVGSAKKANKQAGTTSLKLTVGKKAKREARRSGKLIVTLKAQFTPAGTKKAITVTRKVTLKK